MHFTEFIRKKMKVTDFKVPEQDQNTLNEVNTPTLQSNILRWLKLMNAFAKLSYSKGFFSFSFDVLIVLNLLILQYFVFYYIYLAIATMADIFYFMLSLILLFILKKAPVLWKKTKK